MKRATLLAAVLLATSAWAADQPGQRFLISAGDLPRPHDTPAAANNPVKISRAGAVPAAPPGFKVALYAENLTSARFLAVAPNGDVFLSERLAGKITLLRDGNGDGKADQRFTFAEGLHNPSGVAVQGGYVYVSDQTAIWRTPYIAGATQAGRLERVTTAPDLRLNGMHGTRNFAFSSDGMLVLEMGSRDNVSEFQPGAKLFQVRDGALVEYAAGLRNAVGVAFYPGSNDLFAAVNERDGLGDNLPPDYFTFVKPGGFYGYPWSYTGANPDPELGVRRAEMTAQAIAPDVLFPAHSAPTGLAFYTGTMFPAQYKNDAFVSLHGSWNSSEPHGYKVVRIHMKNGRVDGHGFENFLTGFWDGQSKTPPQVIGRPVGLAVARDGALLVADDLGNVIWRVSYGK